MLYKRLLGLCALLPALALAAPAQAQTAPATVAAPNCQFQFGFATMAQLMPATVGTCLTNQMADTSGNTMQQTTTGLLSWSKATNVTEFTTGEKTWVDSGYGLILRDGNVSYSWEGPVSLVAGIAINRQGQAINPATGQVIPTDARIQIS